MKNGFIIEVLDCGQYYQVYKKTSDGNEMKMGNILPPGYTHFKGEESSQNWVAEGSIYGRTEWQNMERALAYLISPRGMT